MGWGIRHLRQRNLSRGANGTVRAHQLCAIGGFLLPGDFNADWSDVDSPPRLLARALELRAFEPDNPGLGTYKDRERLDWILISPQLRFVEYTVLPNIVSDHLPVLTRVGWKQTKEAEKDD